MGNELPAAVRSRLGASRAAPAEDKLERARDLVREMRDLTLSIADQEERLREANKKFNELRHKTLPDFFAEVGLRELGLEAEGNEPAYLAKLRPYYKASIAADWDEERRNAAFDALEQHGLGDIIRRVFVVEVDRTNSKAINAVRTALRSLEKRGKCSVSEKRDVPWTTLTATVREQLEKGEALPLETLGATVGQIVEVKPVKDKPTNRRQHDG